jgi:hypothetical protein
MSAMAAAPDFTTLSAAVDFSTLTTALLALFAAMAAVGITEAPILSLLRN